MFRSIGIVAALIAFSSLAAAGGTSWPVKVIEVVRGDRDSATVVMTSQDPEAPWAGCDRVKIRVKFEREDRPIQQLRPDPSLLPKHRDALASLEAATGATGVRFGEMGTGIKRSGVRCEFLSKRLELLEEPDGKKQVYSFYEPTS
jgi:hypothetical protein